MSDRNPHLEIDLVDIENLIELLRESDDDDAPQLSYVADALEGTLARWEGASADAAKYLGQRDEHARYRDQLEPTIDDARRVNAELRDKINAKWAENEALRAERDESDLRVGQVLADAKAELDKTTQDLIAARAERDEGKQRVEELIADLKASETERERLTGLLSDARREKPSADLAEIHRLGDEVRADVADASAPPTHDADEVRRAARSLRGRAEAYVDGSPTERELVGAGDLLDGLIDRQVYDLAVRADLETQLNDCEARVADQANQLAILEKLAAPMLSMDADESDPRDYPPSLDAGDLGMIETALTQRAESLAKYGTRQSVAGASAYFALADKITDAYAEMLAATNDEEDRT